MQIIYITEAITLKESSGIKKLKIRHFKSSFSFYFMFDTFLKNS